MGPTPAPLEGVGDDDHDDHDDFEAWLISVHHEVGNHLAAIRFAAQLARDDPGSLRGSARALDRAAMQAGSLLALSRPLLLIDEPELEVMPVDTLFELVGRELVAQGLPTPQIDVETALPPIRVCTEALQPAITAVALRGAAGEAARLRAALDKGAVMIGLEVEAEADAPERERAVVLRLVERLMDRCEIPFAVRTRPSFSAEFWCRTATSPRAPRPA